jgi:hypothetical protein
MQPAHTQSMMHDAYAVSTFICQFTICTQHVERMLHGLWVQHAPGDGAVWHGTGCSEESDACLPTALP